MWPQCIPPSLDRIWLTVQEQMWFQDFQDGHPGGHLGWRNGTILAILNLYVAPMLSIKFRLNQTYGLGGEEFQDGRRLGFPNGQILAILNLYVAPMLPSGFGSILLTLWEEMSFEEFQDLISERNNFSNSESLPQSLPSSFSSIWLNVLEEMSLEEFQDGRRSGHLGYRNGTILAILNLCVTPMLPIKFWFNPTKFWRRCRLKNYKMATILDIWTEWF